MCRHAAWEVDVVVEGREEKEKEEEEEENSQKGVSAVEILRMIEDFRGYVISPGAHRRRW